MIALFRTGLTTQWCWSITRLTVSNCPPGHPGLLKVALQQTLLVLASFISFASVQKHESSIIPLLVLSESNPLCWALIRLWWLGVISCRGEELHFPTDGPTQPCDISALLKVSLEKSLEGDAVAGLVPGHLVDGLQNAAFQAAYLQGAWMAFLY